MSETFVDFEFDAQDRDATRGANAPNKRDTTDGDGHRLQMTMKVVRQRTGREVFADLCGGLEIEIGMNVFVETSVHHGCQFAPDLSRSMQGDDQDAFLASSKKTLSSLWLRPRIVTPFCQNTCHSISFVV